MPGEGWRVDECVCVCVCVCAGVMGSVEMDEFGDRQTDFAVWDMVNVESGEFQVKGPD